MRRWPVLCALVVTVSCAAEGGGEALTPENAARSSAQAICDNYFACQCQMHEGENPQHSSQVQCEAENEAENQAVLDAGAAAGLTFDGGCAAQQLSLLGTLGCDTEFDFANLERLVAADCKIHYGTVPAGGACTEYEDAQGDDCQADFVCDSGVCAVPLARTRVGDPCDPGDLVCGDFSFCIDVSGGENTVCTQLPKVGETCLGAFDVCDRFLVCDQPTKKCVPAPGIGEPCGNVGACLEDAYCDDADICAPLPTGGRGCVDFQCASGFECDLDSEVCAIAAPIVCDG